GSGQAGLLAHPFPGRPRHGDGDVASGMLLAHGEADRMRRIVDALHGEDELIGARSCRKQPLEAPLQTGRGAFERHEYADRWALVVRQAVAVRSVLEGRCAVAVRRLLAWRRSVAAYRACRHAVA